MEPVLTEAARAGRGLLASVALFLLGGWTLYALTFSCCSSPSLAERLGDSWLWGAFLSFPTPLAALPPLSRRLRGTRVRWALVPSLLASGALSVQFARELEPSMPSILWMQLLTLVPLVVCVLYVLVRVVLARPPAAVTA